MIQRLSVLSILLVSIFTAPTMGQGIIIDHTCTNLTSPPVEYINQARSAFRVWYGHTSHGSQITSGMEGINSFPYTFNTDGSGGALSYIEEDGDLGHNGDLSWATMTRELLNQPGSDRNLVMWSWCGGVSDNSESGINTYLNAMNQLESDFPQVTFIYMTGHLDGSGESGNLNIRNNQIRNYCRTNNKVLFDFADIESYDPDGSYFLDQGATDECNYNDDNNNWADEWCSTHPGSDLCQSCDCQHSHPLNCNLKGRAFWWMMARLAGWGSSSPTPTPPPQATPTFTPSWTPEPCGNTGVKLWMSTQYLQPGDTCHVTAAVCNNQGATLTDYPLFIILDLDGSYFFAPDFSAYNFYSMTFATGETPIEVLPAFTWPNGSGCFNDAIWYGALTDPGVTQLVGDLDTLIFSWCE